MDVSKLFKGQTVDITCVNPECEQTIKVDGNKLFQKNQTVTCPHCDGNIALENNESIKKMENEIKELKNKFK
ncbi:hypothetical protein SAMN05192534_12412 [Alteribacillus persepolensis]|uniref:Uncharacterized protein n=1 Tax=Alteribacillus persepolensis TaxID=568899 RepID=A0A1G8IGD4_9BACI|nr:hypothetical protein [Alteribacillus persepolensis]SDI17994.1 hypothetical protein SAMN05192534_12412 [Alteribacillus persepolensis]